jgi:hypothetical protein
VWQPSGLHPDGLPHKARLTWFCCCLAPRKTPAYGPIPFTPFGDRSGLHQASRPATTPFADFCHAVGCLATSSVSCQRGDLLCRTHGRSPEVSCTACRASLPDLQNAPFDGWRTSLCRANSSQGASRLLSGAGPSARAFAPRFLQTSARNDALALRYPFASIQLGRGLSPPSCATCSAHTAKFSGAAACCASAACRGSAGRVGCPYLASPAPTQGIAPQGRV